MAACLLIELRDCDFREDVEETLTGLPADLFGTYSRFLTRAINIPRRTVFIQAIFRWLVFSTRELQSDELADALAFPLADPKFDFSNPAKSIHDPNRRGGNSDIFKLLEGLIVIKKDSWSKPSIAFAHSSVKDYFLSPQFQQQFSSIIDLTKGVSYKFITQTCVRYLLIFADPKHPMTKDTLPDYPISLYAAKYWFHHLQLCDDQDQEALLPSTMHLLEDGSTQHAALYHLHPLPSDRIGLQVSFSYRTSVWDGPISPAVCMCSEMGYTEGVCSLLIEHNTSVDQVTKDGETALHLASEKGHLDIARLLIEHNASVDLATKDGRTALHLASQSGHLDVVRLLIEHNTSIDQAEHNVSVDLATRDGRTALHLASQSGHLNVVRLLIEHNTSINQADKDGRTALHLASQSGHLDIARLLIEQNASVHLATKDGSTALHLALERGYLNIAWLLIKHNTSVDLATKGGKTVLHHALEGGRIGIARRIIKHSTSVGLELIGS
jgi:ankyrin repeat protein